MNLNLHICNGDKFTSQFVELMNSERIKGNHLYFIAEREVKYPIPDAVNVIYLKDFQNRLNGLIHLMWLMNKSSSIIIHGLFGKIIYILFSQPWLLKKCRWVIWGGDLYIHLKPKGNLIEKFEEFARKFVIARLGYIQYWIKGDYEFAKAWYGTRAKFVECLMYPSNTFTPMYFPRTKKDRLTILVGNSADPSNNHIEVFTKLKEIDDGSMLIICPLSYGDMKYADTITVYGKELFAERFLSLRDYMSLDEYRKILFDIDIAIFAHKRQQALGNTISLLGYGKKVYMRDDVTPWQTFHGMGLTIFPLHSLNLSPISETDSLKNTSIISNGFSKHVLVRQLNHIF